ncbi:LTA synthase family protein [Streptococcus suis]|uniref:LTA synthase family protein n=1 Tax=Streptococcus suis TaxID=1307 RepID=UPI002AA4083B|nr:LTA synthase family protein [Streptococcus suis]HEM6560978.1 LTA synthase family protein [Streptococcus suis]
MKFLKLIVHWLLSFLMCVSFIHYTHLIKNELSASSKINQVKIVAGGPQLYLEGIQINGKYVSSDNFLENDWYVADVDVLTEFYISRSLGDTITISPQKSIQSLAFEYNVTSDRNKIEIFVNNRLFETIDTSKGNGHRNIAFIPLSQGIKMTKDNFIWYLHLIFFGIGILIFIIKGMAWKINRKKIAILLILLLVEHTIISLSFSLFYSDQLILFNSRFNEINLVKLVHLFSLLTVVCIASFHRLLNKLWKKINKFISIIVFCAVPYLSLFIIENTYSQFSPLSNQVIQNNLLIIWLVYIILSLFFNIRRATLALLPLSLLIGLVNKVMIDSRGTPLLYYNLFQIEDGLNVASNVALQLNNKMLQSITITMLSIIVYTFVPYIKFPKLSATVRCNDRYDTAFLKKFIRIVAGLSLILLFPFISQKIVENADIPLNRWRMYATYGESGLPLSLASFYEDSKITKPDGYSASKLSEVLEKYSPETEKQTIRPNIIFIQNESQSDFSNLQGLSMDPDPLSNQHALTDNAVHGTLNVSVFGGGTANTEYEVLTSNAISLLSSNLFPYQQIITQERPSFASYLKNKNYETVALHPQTGINYNRKIVYPLLGFEQNYFSDSVPTIQTLADFTTDRSWPSDQFLFNGIKELYKQKGNRPLFSFVVTMQGHGGYLSTEETYPREVSINGSTSEYLAETEFLTSMKKTDEAFADLITFFSTYKEPTVVVMYGDHQPSLSQEFYAQFMDENNPAAKYSTPFVIWSNFDIKERESTTISPNYLVPYLMDILSESDYALPRSPYQQFLSDMQIEAPIITSWGNIDNSGQQIEDISSLSLYQTYLQLEYNSAVDKRPLTDLYE